MLLQKGASFFLHQLRKVQCYLYVNTYTLNKVYYLCGMIAIRTLNGDLRVNVDINEGSSRRVELMKEDYINLKFSLDKPIALEMGDYVDFSQHREEFPFLFDLARFELTTDYVPTYNVETGGYDYDLRLDAEYIKWGNKIFKYQPKYGGREASWSLTAKPSVFFGLITKNLASLGFCHDKGFDKSLGTDYKIGFYSEEDVRLYDQKVISLSFSDTNIIDALTQIAEACDPSNNTCSWWFEKGWIYFGRCEIGERLDLEIGKNVHSMTSSEGQEDRVNRIYAFGSDKNISPRYRKTLIFNSTSVKNINGKTGVVDEFRVISPKMFKEAAHLPVENNVVDIPRVSKSVKKSLTLSWEGTRCIGRVSPDTIMSNFANSREEFDVRFGGVSVETGKIFFPHKISGSVTFGITDNGVEEKELVFASTGDYTSGITNKATCDGITKSVSGASEKNYAVSSDISLEVELFPNMGVTRLNSIQFFYLENSLVLYTTNREFANTGQVNITSINGNVLRVLYMTESAYNDIRNSLAATNKTPYYLTINNVIKSQGNYYTLDTITKVTIGSAPYFKYEVESMALSYDYSLDFIKVGVTTDSIKTKMTILDNDYNAVKTYDVTLNPFGYPISSKEYNYFVFDSDKPNLSSFKYTLSWFEDGIEKTDLILGRVSYGYFTNKYAYKAEDEADAKYLSGAVVTNLMLPDKPVYRKADGTLTFTKTSEMVYDGSGRIGEDVPEEKIREKVVVFDDIYPTYVSHVSDVEFTTADQVDDKTGEKTGVTLYEYTFKDKNFPNFTPKDFVSEKIYITFADVEENGVFHSGGKLNGMTFELGIVKTDDTGTTFNIIRDTSSSVPLPNEILFPQEGDGYNIYGFDTSFVDDSLTEKAELELVRQSLLYIERSNKDKNTYSCVMMSNEMFEENMHKFMYRLGDAVKLVNPLLFGEEGRNSRIVAVEHKLDFPFDAPTLTIGETSEYSSIGALQDNITTINMVGSAVNFNMSGNGVNIYIVKTGDRIGASDTNVFSSSRTLEEIAKALEKSLLSYDEHFLRKDKDDETPFVLSVGGLHSKGDARVDGTLNVNRIQGNANGEVEVDADVRFSNPDRKLKVSKIYGAQDGGDVDINDNMHVGKEDVTFNGGIKHREFVPDILTGDKWQIDGEGNAELQSLIIREFLEVPELRYNRVTVQSGTTWNASGSGIIKEVLPNVYFDEQLHTTCGQFKLKLEEGEIGSFAVNDVCMGIWHFSDEPISNLVNREEGDTERYQSMSDLNEKEDGTGAQAGLLVSGFATIYFSVLAVSDYTEDVVEIIEDERVVIDPDTNIPTIVPAVTKTTKKTYTNGLVKFALRWDAKNISKALPQKAMAIVAYGNTQDPSRQTSSYATRTFKRYLFGVNSFDINFKNIAMHIGDMTDMSITSSDGREISLNGYSAYLNNIYMTGTIDQLDILGDIPVNYLVEMSKHIEVINLDNEGNVVGGLVNNEGGYATYAIYTAVTVMQGDKYLTLYDPSVHADQKGHYTISAQGNGCDVDVDRSTIRVTSVHGTRTDKTGVWTDKDYSDMRALERCSVDVYVMIENGAAITRTFYLTINHLEDPIFTIDLDNPNAAISWNTRTGAYVGFPITTNVSLFRNSEDIKITKISVDAVDESDNVLFAYKGDETGVLTPCEYINTIRETENGVFKGYSSLLTFKDDNHRLESTLPEKFYLKIKVGAHYCGVDYFREAVMTIHKSIDSNVYQLKPSNSQFRASWDGAKWVFNATTLTCDVVCIPLSGEPYILSDAQKNERGIVVKYKTDSMTISQTLTSYNVASGDKNIRIELFEGDYSWDSDDIPVNYDGVDGNDIERVFFRQESWRGATNDSKDLPTPQIYNTNSPDINGKTFQEDEYLPYAENSTGASAKHWTDNPTGVNGTYKFEFYAQRKKVKGVWQPFGQVNLWNNFSIGGGKGEDAIVYELVPQISVIRLDKTGNIVSGNTISCKVLRSSGESKTFLDVNTEGGIYELQCYLDNVKTSVKANELTPQVGEVIITPSVKTIQWRLYDKDNKAIIDYQDIPILQSGDNGVMVYVENQNINVPTDFDGKITGTGNSEAKFHLFSGTKEADDVQVVLKGTNDAITSNAVAIDDTAFPNVKLITWHKNITFDTTALVFTVSSAKMGIALDTTINIVANRTGADGAGREMVFFRIDDWNEDGGQTPTPTIFKPYPTYTNADGNTMTFNDDDYLPFTDNAKTNQWADNPPKVDSTHRYVFYSTRRKIDNRWQDFDEVRLWNKFTKDGVDNLYAKCDIERIDITCNAEGKARSQSSKDILFYLYKGDKEINITSVDVTIQGYSGTGCSVTDYASNPTRKTFGWVKDWVVVECDLKATIKGYYEAEDTGAKIAVTRYLSIGVAPSIGGESGVSPVIRELEPEQSVLPFDEYGKALFPNGRFSCHAISIRGEVQTNMTLGTDYFIRYSLNGGAMTSANLTTSADNKSVYGEFGKSGFTSKFESFTWYLVDKDENILDYQSLVINHSSSSVVRCYAVNGNVNISCDENNNVSNEAPTSVKITFRASKGVDDYTDSIKSVAVNTSLTGNYSSINKSLTYGTPTRNEFPINIVKGQKLYDGTIYFTITYGDNKTQDVAISINAIKQGQIGVSASSYELVPLQNALLYRNDKPNINKASCKATLTEGINDPVYVNFETNTKVTLECEVKYRTSKTGALTTRTYTKSGSYKFTLDDSNTASIVLYSTYIYESIVWKLFVNSQIVDSQDMFISVSGENGKDAIFAYTENSNLNIPLNNEGKTQSSSSFTPVFHMYVGDEEMDDVTYSPIGTLSGTGLTWDSVEKCLKWSANTEISTSAVTFSVQSTKSGTSRNVTISINSFTEGTNGEDGISLNDNLILDANFALGENSAAWSQFLASNTIVKNSVLGLNAVQSNPEPPSYTYIDGLYIDFMHQDLKDKVATGHWYTLSFYASGTYLMVSLGMYLDTTQVYTGNGIKVVSGDIVPTLTSTMKKYVYSFYASNFNGGILRFLSQKTKYAKVCGVKLEEGQNASAFSLNAADTAAYKVISTTYYYALSSSPSILRIITGYGWSTTKHATNGNFLWRYVKETFSNGTYSYERGTSADAVCISGDRGLSGATMRGVSIWQEGVEYVHDTTYIDVVRYTDGNIYAVKAPTGSSLSRTTTKVPTDTTDWEQFNNMKPIATSMILADSGYIDVLGLGSVFIGSSLNDVVYNPDGTRTLVTNANGWQITQGAMTHTKTGLSLTSDGKLSIPTGALSFKVGNTTYTDIENAINDGKIRPNLIPHPYFDNADSYRLTDRSGASTTYKRSISTGMNTQDVQNAASPYNIYMFGFNNTATAANGDMYTTDIIRSMCGRRLLLKANTKYTLTIKAMCKSGIVTTSSFYFLYNSHDATSYGSNFGSVNLALTSSYKDFSITFTTGNTALYFDFRLGVKFALNSATECQVYFNAVKLEEGTKFTGWVDNIPPTLSDIQGMGFIDEETLNGKGYLTPQELLETGIDILNKQIIATANNFVIRNNSGKETFYIDKYGNAVISGYLSEHITLITNADEFLAAFIPTQSIVSMLANGEWSDTIGGEDVNMYLDNMQMSVRGAKLCVSNALDNKNAKELVMYNKEPSVRNAVMLDMKCASGVIDLEYAPYFNNEGVAFIAYLPMFKIDTTLNTILGYIPKGEVYVRLCTGNYNCSSGTELFKSTDASIYKSLTDKAECNLRHNANIQETRPNGNVDYTLIPSGYKLWFNIRGGRKISTSAEGVPNYTSQGLVWQNVNAFDVTTLKMNVYYYHKSGRKVTTAQRYSQLALSKGYLEFPTIGGEEYSELWCYVELTYRTPSGDIVTDTTNHACVATKGEFDGDFLRTVTTMGNRRRHYIEYQEMLTLLNKRIIIMNNTGNEMYICNRYDYIDGYWDRVFDPNSGIEQECAFTRIMPNESVGFTFVAEEGYWEEADNLHLPILYWKADNFASTILKNTELNGVCFGGNDLYAE